jgi:hypothetical protein
MPERFDIGETPIDDTPNPIERVGTPVPLWLSTFLTPLEVTPLDDGRTWRIDETFDYESVVLGRIITVQAGEVTDFASIPRAFYPIFLPTGPYARAAGLHDHLYRAKGEATRAQADAVFLEAMTTLGVNRVTRQILYRGVRWFGGSSYKGGLG